jgi:hypothetical protein
VLSADVVEVDVDRRVLLEQPRHRSVVVVERGVEAELARHPVDLLGRTRRTDDLGRTEQPRHLPGGRADSAGGPGDEHRLARLHRRDPGEADVRRHARHAEHAQVCRRGHPRHVDDAHLSPGQQRVLAPTCLVQHGGADRHPLVTRCQDLADRATLERGVEAEGWQVGPGVVHPAAHVGVDRQVGVAHEHLAGAGIGQCRLHGAEVVVGGPSEGPGGQVDLPRGSRHAPILPLPSSARQVPQITVARSWERSSTSVECKGCLSGNVHYTRIDQGRNRPAEGWIVMTSQLYLARGIAAGMIHSDQDPALVRSAQIARVEARRERRGRRVTR